MSETAAREQVRESARLAFDAIRSHRLRSGLVILGVAIGVATLMGMVAILRGLGAKIEADVSSSDRVVITVARYNFVAENPGEEAVQKRRHLEPEDAEFIEKHCDLVERVNFYVEASGRMTVLRHGGRRTGLVSLVGSEPDMAFIYSIPVDQGRLFTADEMRRRRKVALLGFGPAQDLFKGRDPLGRRLRIEGEEYEVVGTFAERKNIFGRLAENYVVVPYTTFAKQHMQRNDERYVQMALRPGADPQEAVEEVSQLVRVRRRLAPDQPDDFTVITSDAVTEFVSRITRPIGLALVVISSIGLMVGGIGVMNIMLVSVTERTQEIGIRKALGATRRDVLLQFLVEAASLTGAGGVIGVALGLGLAVAVREAAGFPFALSPLVILLAVVFSAGIGIGFGLWPANRAARLDPIAALRHE